MRKTQPQPSTVRVDRKKLLAALQRIGGVVPTHAGKPILQGVRLEACGGKLTLSGTNLETSLTTSVAVDGDIALCVLRYADVIARVRTGKGDVCTLTLDPTQNALIVNGGAVEHRVSLLDLKEYPPIPTQPEGTEWRVHAAEFRQALSVALRAAARESTRYAIDGILLEVDQKGARLVATDGRRMVLTEIERQEGPYQGDVILPRSVATLVGKLVERKSQDVVAVFVKPNTDAKGQPEPSDLYVVGPDWLLVTKAIDGQFPRYRDIIPRSHSRFRVERIPLLDTLASVATATDEADRGVRLDLAAEAVRVSASGIEGAAACGVVPAQFIGGGDNHIITAFNAAFLFDALQTLAEDRVVIDVEQNHRGRTDDRVYSRPAVLFGHDPAQPNATGRICWLLMPVNLDLPASRETLGSNFAPGEPRATTQVQAVPIPVAADPAAETSTPLTVNADAGSAEAVPTPAEVRRRRSKVDHAWPEVGTVLEAVYEGQTYTALVIAAPKLKAGRALQVITGPATGQVFNTLTAAMEGATAKQRRKLGLGKDKRSLPKSGWDFWIPAQPKRASA
jgi:DNA polymerase III subunit beta